MRFEYYTGLLLEDKEWYERQRLWVNADQENHVVRSSEGG